MNILNKVTQVALAVSIALTGTAKAEDFSFAEAVKNADVKLSFRARVEAVEQDNTLDDATAFTNRTRLTFNSASFGNWKLNIEMDNIAALVEDYNSVTNGRTDYSVVADPAGTDLNLGNISYSSESFTSVIGRQRINFDGQRFVGGVGWRQNEQTFDAISFQTSFGNDFTMHYAYVHNVNNIFDRNILGQHHIINGSYAVSENHQFGFTAVYLDPDNVPAIGSSTFALDYKGSAGFIKWNIAWATQKDDGDAPINYEADYQLAELVFDIKPIAITVGQEVLGSDNGVRGFSTPLATLHKFQGFADIFLATPDNGVEDNYIKASGKIGTTKLAITYHDFNADFGSSSYGSEVDLVANFKLSEQYSLLAKYASYSADEYAVDTDKIWLMLSANY